MIRGSQIKPHSITQDRLNLASPESSSDAATKGYVDNTVAGIHVEMPDFPLGASQMKINPLGGLEGNAIDQLQVHYGPTLQTDGNGALVARLGAALHVGSAGDIAVKYGPTLQVDAGNTLVARLGAGLHVDSADAIAVNYGPTLQVDSNNTLVARLGAGLHVGGYGDIAVNCGPTMFVDGGNQLVVNHGPGLQVDGSSRLVPKVGPTMQIDGAGQIVARLGVALHVDGSGQIAVNYGPTMQVDGDGLLVARLGAGLHVGASGDIAVNYGPTLQVDGNGALVVRVGSGLGVDGYNQLTLSGSYSGTFTATAFSGSGAALTSLNASNLGSGTVPGARIKVSPTMRVDDAGGLAVNAGGGLYVNGSSQLAVKVSPTMQVDGAGGIAVNAGGGLYVNSSSQLEVKVSPTMRVDGAGGIAVNAGGGLYVNGSNQLAVKVSPTMQVDGSGAIAVRNGNGLNVDGSGNLQLSGSYSGNYTVSGNLTCGDIYVGGSSFHADSPSLRDGDNVVRFNASRNGVTDYAARGGGWQHAFKTSDGTTRWLMGSNSGDGTFYTGGLSQGWSDARLKENITTVDSAEGLARVQNYRVVDFVWNEKGRKFNSSKKEGEVERGLIAQEARSVNPAVVVRNLLALDENDEPYLSIQDRPILFDLIGAVQEQQKQIAALIAALADLKIRVN